MNLFNTKINTSTIFLFSIVAMFIMYIYCQQTSGIERMTVNPETMYYLDKQKQEFKDEQKVNDNPVLETTSKCNPTNFASVNLLPKENDVVRDDAFEFAPKDLTKINFIDAKEKIGENSIGNSLRNANLQLRAEPANPQTPVSPWQNSTIEPDLFRQPWE
jgi:hypothetical protein